MSISPTIPLAQAARRKWDVVVVGGGPAGSLTAHGLAQAGVRVLLVDKASFPRSKACGCCLSPRAVRSLADAGLAQILPQGGAVPVRELQLFSHGRRSRLPLPGGVVLSRHSLDAALIGAAVQEGSHFLPGTLVRSSTLFDLGRKVELRHKAESVLAEASVVIAADGLGGHLTRGESAVRALVHSDSRVGAAAIVEQPGRCWAPGVIYMACGRAGYLGLVRLENGCLNAAAAVTPRAVIMAGGLAPLSQTILREAGLDPVPALATTPWHGTPLLTRHLGRPWAERLFVVGDAAGYVEPFTGEGMACALSSARALVPLALRALDRWESRLGSEWTLTHRALVRERERVIRIASAVLRRPGLTRLLVSLSASAPSLARPVIAYLNRP
jgi:flavin-dependent dehydrogenase